MDREEILEKSRRENRERDEMEREVRIRGESFSLMCTLLAGGVLAGWKLYHNQSIADVMVMFWASCVGNRVYRIAQRRDASDIITLLISRAFFVYYLVQCFHR